MRATDFESTFEEDDDACRLIRSGSKWVNIDEQLGWNSGLPIPNDSWQTTTGLVLIHLLVVRSELVLDGEEDDEDVSHAI